MRTSWWFKIEKIFWGILLLATFLFLLRLRYIDNLSLNWKGALFFFLVPLWLWAIGTLFIKRNEFTAKIFAFIAGSDNRLSLSRLQAFAWTLVIFGSWVAAMGIHTKIIPVTQAKANEFTEQAKITKTQSDAHKISWDKRNAEYNDYAKAKDEAEKKFRDADAHVKALIQANSNTDDINKPQQDLDQARRDLTKATILLQGAENTRNEAQKLYQDSLAKTVEIENTVSGLNWVTIPAALLALAGIAIGSGVFSSIISAINSEDKTACLTSIVLITSEQFKLDYPNLPQPASNNLLRIRGRDFDKTGRVRLAKGRIFSVFAPILYWKDDGTEIVVDVPANADYDIVIVDTPNGKLTHKLNIPSLKEGLSEAGLTKRLDEVGPLANLEKDKKDRIDELTTAQAELNRLSPDAEEDEKKIARQAVKDAEAAVSEAETRLAAAKASLEKLPGKELLSEFKYFYEFSDLFRDDKNPNNMDLMKFQMFGWTVVAIVIYSFLFLNDLRANIESLPLVPESIVILTGLSQAGYLAGKGISNIESNKNQANSTQK